MKLFGRQKKDEIENKPEEPQDSFESFEASLESTLKEEHTQVIADKKEESKSKAMVRTLLDSGYSIIEINEFLSSNKTFGLKDGQIRIL